MTITDRMKHQDRRHRHALTAIKCIGNAKSRDEMALVVVEWDMHQRREIMQSARTNKRDGRSFSQVGA